MRKSKLAEFLIFILVGALETVNFWAGLYPSTYNFVVVERKKYFDELLFWSNEFSPLDAEVELPQGILVLQEVFNVNKKGKMQLKQ